MDPEIRGRATVCAWRDANRESTGLARFQPWTCAPQLNLYVFERDPGPFDQVFLGASTLLAGVDPDVLDEAWTRRLGWEPRFFGLGQVAANYATYRTLARTLVRGWSILWQRLGACVLLPDLDPGDRAPRTRGFGEHRWDPDARGWRGEAEFERRLRYSRKWWSAPRRRTWTATRWRRWSRSWSHEGPPG